MRAWAIRLAARALPRPARLLGLNPPARRTASTCSIGKSGSSTAASSPELAQTSEPTDLVLGVGEDLQRRDQAGLGQLEDETFERDAGLFSNQYLTRGFEEPLAPRNRSIGWNCWFSHGNHDTRIVGLYNPVNNLLDGRGFSVA